MTLRLSRRALLRWIPPVLLAAIAPGAGPRRARASVAAARIGDAYLRLHPEEASPRTLARLLGADAAPDAVGSARLRERIRADFAEARVVRIRGWVLSRTEARLCALSHLTGGPV